MHSYQTSCMGRFISVDIWQEAIRLLEFQISQKQNNRRYHTISMFYYEKLGKLRERAKDPEYYRVKIASNLFYGLEDEFRALPYIVPKPGLDFRGYMFLSYPMRLVYYSVGIYLIKLTQEFVDNYALRNDCFRSFYGGHLRFDNDGLVVNKVNTQYYSFYKSFRKVVRGAVRTGYKNKIIMRLDIARYFDEVVVSKLMDLIAKSVKDSMQAKLHFDDVTRCEIVSFLKFLMGGKDGIPQSDNCIVSDFIGYLYLVFGDMAVDEVVRNERSIVESHMIVRYVDDFYISLDFCEGASQQERELAVERIVSKVADRFYLELGLRFNKKSEMFWLNQDEDRERILKDIKKASPEYYVKDEEDDESPQNKLNNILDELLKLKSSPLPPSLSRNEGVQSEIFKDVFDLRVQQLMNQSDYKRRINEMFVSFNFDLVKVQPIEIMVIVQSDDGAFAAFKKFLMEKKDLTARDANLLLIYLCQCGFADSEVLDKICEYSPMMALIGAYKRASIKVDRPGYYSLTDDKCEKIAGMPHVVEQVRKRIVSERDGDYAVALNHLLNEVHGICRDQDEPNSKDYDVNKTVKYCEKKGVPVETCMSIRNLFDLRNNNGISHPGNQQQVLVAVSKTKYYQYKDQVGKGLDYIL